ncbi:MAG: putative Ig domain-containing protein [Bryobacterales bacterium]|nr:putative Ig domain-containing protein [Bryobacterales bacterium]
MLSSSRLYRALLVPFLAGIALAQSPQITSLSSTPTPVYAGQAFTLNITGTNFCIFSSVQFGGDTFPGTWVSDTLITASIPGPATITEGNLKSVRVISADSPYCAVPGSGSNIVDWVINQPPPINLSPTSLPNTSIGATYNSTVVATGGVGAPYNFEVVTGSLPPGLGIGQTTGVISGIPNSSGTFNFAIGAGDSVGTFGTRGYSIVVTQALTVPSASTPNGTVGISYSYNVVAQGGTTPYSFSLSPQSAPLPPGLSIAPSGLISGIPTTSGIYNVSVRVQDANSSTATGFLTIQINPALSITTTSLPSGTYNAPYSQTLAASGGSTPYTFGLASGVLPQGVNLQPNGTIAGVPTRQGIFNFIASVQSSGGGSATRAFTLVIDGPLTFVTTSPLPGGTVGTPYSTQLQATGAVPSTVVQYIFSVASGSALPPGLNLSAGGLIGGTPTAPGTFNFVLQVQDLLGNAAFRNFAMVVAPSGSVFITTTSLPSGTAGLPYSQPITATGGIAPYTFIVNGGSLPPGLSLSSAGTVLGTPTTGGNYTFTVRVTEQTGTSDSRTFSIPIGQELSILTNSFSPGTEGANYAEAVIAEGGYPPYRFSLVGDPPPGMTMLLNGFFSGTPSRAGSYTVRVRVEDSGGEGASSVTKNIPFTVNAGVRITTSSLPNATVGNDYVQTLTASGGETPYIWSPVGALPAGLTLATNGVLSGRPQNAGAATVTVQVRDSRGATDTKPLALTIVPASATPQITTTSLPAGTVGTAYNQTLNGTGGQTPYAWSLTGNPPPGLTLNATTGALTGTPTQAGTYSLQVQLRDAANVTANATLGLTINAAGSLQITTTSLPVATQNAPYSQQLAASGGQTPYTWSLLEGSVPGITLNPQGLLAGTPTQTGTFTLQVRVLDNQERQAVRTLTLQVQNVLNILTTSLPGATLNTAYTTQISAAGGVPPYSWSILSGAPQGLSINNQGILSGTPTQAGTYSLQVQVRDTAGTTANRTFTLAVQSVLQITTSTLPGATLNNPYQTSLAAAGGTQPYSWSTSSALPAGISLSTEGVLSGTPTQPGSFPLSITVRDSREASASATLTLTIGTNLQILTNAVPAAVPGNSYSTVFTASGGVLPYQWSAPNGLPPGLQLDPVSGALSGVLPLTATNYSFVIQVRDAANQIASRSYTLLTGSLLTIVNTSLRQGVTGTLYQETLIATGGIGPYTWSSFGSLPPGLILNPTTGFLTGSPLTPGTYNVNLRVTDAAGQFVDRFLLLEIVTNLRILSTLPEGLGGTPYSQLLAASGGTPPYTWALNGSIPGLTLDSFTGLLAGTPTTPGSYPVTISVTDSLGVTVPRAFTVVIAVPLTIAPDTLPSAGVGTAYSQTFTASGGTAPYFFQLASGNVPGLILNGIAGALQGTPTQAGSYPITIRVTDGQNRQANRNYTLVVSANLRILTSSLAPAVQRAPYNVAFEAAGGTPPYSWTSPSALPAGLTLSSSGQLSGTPADAGSFPLVVEVRDANGLTTSANLTLTVQPGLTIQTTGALPNATLATPYAFQMTATGGTVPLTWRVLAGRLPDGLAIEGNGRIAGTPTAAGNSSATIEVTDVNGLTASAAITLRVLPALLRITSAAQIPAVTAGTDFQFAATATGGTPPYTWTLNGAPSGLTIDAASGAISGRLAAPGTFTFQLQLTDAAGVSTEQQLSVQASLPPVPPLTITNVPATVQAGQQVIPGLSLGSPFPVPINGELVLTFAPDGTIDDPAIQFANGGRRVAFTIPAGSLQPSLTPSQVGIQVGTVAGTITITASMTAGGVNVTPTPAPSQIIRIPRAAPVISSLRVNRTAAGFEIIVVGFATSREVTGATVRLQTSGSVQGNEFTINLTQPMQAWYQSAASLPHGSAFALTLPFNIQTSAGGGTITSVSVTLTNAVGTSAAATANF